ncbi:hypothetical protein PIB30_046201 [Stylosanthes scabra]|uniref:Uncharacterized protein n=1 Tax=Stylosanthes scabra TaxID=79078 RepID=A0ABU6ZF51_9FABA|nr:hypothetical protein [Stylosanthes scabra]
MALVYGGCAEIKAPYSCPFATRAVRSVRFAPGLIGLAEYDRFSPIRPVVDRFDEKPLPFTAQSRPSRRTVGGATPINNKWWSLVRTSDGLRWRRRRTECETCGDEALVLLVGNEWIRQLTKESGRRYFYRL